jgi:hypothetical protein
MRPFFNTADLPQADLSNTSHRYGVQNNCTLSHRVEEHTQFATQCPLREGEMDRRDGDECEPTRKQVAATKRKSLGTITKSHVAKACVNLENEVTVTIQELAVAC